MSSTNSEHGSSTVVPRFTELEGKVAVVTGAAQGMGASFVEGLVRQGVNVYAVDVNEPALESTLERIASQSPSGSVWPRIIDVSSQKAMSGLATEVTESSGRLDIWVNNAGLFPQSDIQSVGPEQIDRTFGVNVNGVFYGAQAAASVMRDGGCIVNMASVAASRVRPGRAIYSATKAAVKNLTNSLSVELGHLGIRVNAIAPGFIDTEMTAWIHESPEAFDKAMSSIPLRRLGDPKDVLDVLLFLVSDLASYVSGHTVSVDGGSLHG